MQEPDEAEFPDEAPCFTLRAQTRLWRVYDPAYGAVSFNPNVGADPADPFRGGRFHPFLQRASGMPVPTMYAGRSLHCAIAETILHDLPRDRPSTGYRISSRLITAQRFAVIRPRRSLKLLQLTMPAVRQFGGTADEVSLVGVDQYPATRRWARAFHSRYADICGLVWASRRFGTVSAGSSAAALVLFGDRCKTDEFEIELQALRLDVEGMPALGQLLKQTGVIVYPA